MGAQVPLVMALDDPGAAPGVVGGKGASLARLARAGFRVPPGFHVTTSAYLDFIGGGGLREPVLAAMSAVDVAGQPVASQGPAAGRRGQRNARRRDGTRHHAAYRSRQAGEAGRRGRLGPAAVRPAGRGHPLGRQLTGHGDDLFLLELPEIVDLLRGDTAPSRRCPLARAPPGPTGRCRPIPR